MRVKKDINIQIGERIKAAREQTGRTQEQLAEAIEVSPQYISDLERGVVGISIPTLKRLCTSLAVSSDQILFDRQTELYAMAIGEKCRNLSESQFHMVLAMIDCVLNAVEEERKTNFHGKDGNFA